MRTCTKCGETKPETEYYKTGKGHKRHGSCKVCYKANVAKNKDPVRIRDLSLQKAYGITSKDYSEILESQGGVCDSCKRPPPNQRKKFLAVDHDHQTGQVRGLLCDNCNRALGLLGDDAQTISNLLAYKQKWTNHPESPTIS